jgi:hypothetical protein
MRPFLILLTFAVACSGGGAGVKGEGGRGDDRPPLDCGFNAFDGGGDTCECVSHYTTCRDDAKSCCAYNATSFQLTVVSAGLMPFKPDGSGWDWDGDVPDWMVDLANTIGYFSAEAATIAEVLQYTDEYAPYLLEGTVPADPFYSVWVGDDVVDASWTVDDDLAPQWGMETWVRPTAQADAYLWFEDEDLVIDDDIMVITVPRDTFDTVAGWGQVTFFDLGRCSVSPLRLRRTSDPARATKGYGQGGGRPTASIWSKENLNAADANTRVYPRRQLRIAVDRCANLPSGGIALQRPVWSREQRRAVVAAQG